jgi:transposase
MMPFVDFKVESVAGALTMRVTERADLLAKDEQMDGKYALVTNLTEPDGAGILRHYKSRAKIEQRNKDLKSHLRLRPIFVHTEERIHGLVLVNFLALLVYSLLEVALRRMGRDETARKILRQFKGSTTALATAPDGTPLVFEIVPPKPDESRLLAGIAAVVQGTRAA